MVRAWKSDNDHLAFPDPSFLRPLPLGVRGVRLFCHLRASPLRAPPRHANKYDGSGVSARCVGDRFLFSLTTLWVHPQSPAMPPVHVIMLAPIPPADR